LKGEKVEQVWVGTWLGRTPGAKQEGGTKGREKIPKTSVFSFKIILRDSPRSRRGKEYFFFPLFRNQAKTIRVIFLIYASMS